MIRKSDHFELIDKYLDSELSQAELSELESQLAFDSDLVEELDLHVDVQHAVAETDIVKLREKLNTIISNKPDTDTISVIDAYSFELSEDLNSWESLNNQINSQSAQSIEHSFPKMHLYQHKIAGKEKIHQFYKEQDGSIPNKDEELFSELDEKLFSEIQNALEEIDILEFRANLNQIAKSIPAHQFTSEQIDDYLSDCLDYEIKALFEEEMMVNQSLANDVQLIRDIDLAWAENDIVNLRATLQNIQKSESKVTNRIEQIEGYINNELSEDQLSSFEAELAENKDLWDEINLIKNIDKAISESDVMNLRGNIQDIAAKIASEKQSERSFLGKLNARKVIYGAVAASLIIMLSLSTLI